MTMPEGGGATDATVASLKLINTPKTVTIASGTALTAAINLADRRPCRIEMPAAWTAAALTFQVSSDGVTFRDFYDQSGNEYSISAAAALINRAILMTINGWIGVQYLKIRSGTSSAPVNQAAQRDLTLVAT